VATNPGLSLCLIARDSAATLERCLKSVEGLVDEIVLVDTGSSDNTLEMARSLGAVVFQRPWTDDFAAARNAAIDAATMPRILFLDSDEFVAPESREALAGLRTAPLLGYSVTLQDIEPGGRRGRLCRITRAFPRNSLIRYRWPVHEQVDEALKESGIPVMASPLLVLHTGYATREARVAKQRRNLEILQRQLSGQSGQPVAMTLYLAGGAWLDLGRPSEARELFERCRRSCEVGSELEQAALVRTGTCFALLKEWGALAGLEGAGPVDGWHPELWMLRGKAALELGSADAPAWFLRVIRSTPKARIPPYDPGLLLVEAVVGLATYLNGPGGRPDVGLELLRCVLAQRDQGDFSPDLYLDLLARNGLAD
jgi:hypothetical protein